MSGCPFEETVACGGGGGGTTGWEGWGVRQKCVFVI